MNNNYNSENEAFNSMQKKIRNTIDSMFRNNQFTNTTNTSINNDNIENQPS